MVATVGPGWKLSPSLVLLVAETSLKFPSRSIASDGSIGDAAHASRTSDHNPKDGWVDAVDLTDDDMHGCDVGLLYAHLCATRDPRVKYLIHKGTIVASYPTAGRNAWQPGTYTGINAHEKHLHVSVLPEGRFSTAPWWPTAPAPTPVPVVEDDVDMVIVTCPGNPTRLLAPPTCAVLDAPTVLTLTAAGVKTAQYTKTAYDAMLAHIDKALA